MPYRRKPSDIRFCQKSIKSHWKATPGTIGETLDQLLKDEISVDEIEVITVKEINGNLYSADNRRLWVFKKLEQLGKCETIPIIFGKICRKKFTTENLGTSVNIRGSKDPGGRIWKMLEKDSICSTLTVTEKVDSALDNRSSFKSHHSTTADERTETTLTSALENTLQIDEMEKTICLRDIWYFQTDPLPDGESLGEVLDKWLQMDLSKYVWKLQIFKRSGKYYTKECSKLWALKNLEKFSKSPVIEFIETYPPYQDVHDSNVVHFLSDSLKLRPTALIGGSVWNNIDFLKKLPTLERVKSTANDIYFTKTTILDTYENKSIAKFLADLYTTMQLPRIIRAVKFEKKYYALDNEILWIVKETEKMKGPLIVSVDVKIEMDQSLFRGFISENIQEVTVQQTSYSHTNEELFIFECLKKIPMT